MAHGQIWDYKLLLFAKEKRDFLLIIIIQLSLYHLQIYLFMVIQA